MQLKYPLLFIVLALTVVQYTFAQSYPRPIALSERVGEAIEPAEKLYFDMFPGINSFTGATVAQVSDTTYSIAVSAGPESKTLLLNDDRFFALRSYIDNFELRYTGAVAHNWDYILPYIRSLPEPFGPRQQFKIELTSGQKTQGYLVFADESGVFLSKEVFEGSPEQTAHTVSFYPRQTLLRVTIIQPYFKSLIKDLDIYYAGEANSYTSFTQQVMQKDALYPRALPPEIERRRPALKEAFTDLEASTNWSSFPAPPRNTNLHFTTFYSLTPFLYPSDPYTTYTGILALDGTSFVGDSTARSIDTNKPTFYLAARFNLSNRFLLGISTTRQTQISELAFAPSSGGGGTPRQIVAQSPGETRFSGQFYNFDLSYLLKVARDYTRFFPSKPGRFSEIELKLTAGPSYASLTTITAARGLLGEEGYINSLQSEENLIGGHATLEANIFVSRFLSFGGMIDVSAYPNYTAPAYTLIDPNNNPTRKTVTGFTKTLWLTAFYFGVSFHI